MEKKKQAHCLCLGCLGSNQPHSAGPDSPGHCGAQPGQKGAVGFSFLTSLEPRDFLLLAPFSLLVCSMGERACLPRG